MTESPLPADENPLAESPERDKRIRERAYHLWENEGRPHDRDDEYWARACALDAMASHPTAGLLPIETRERIDEAEIEQNLGEFPGRLADQGERQPAPSPRAEVPLAARNDR